MLTDLVVLKTTARLGLIACALVVATISLVACSSPTAPLAADAATPDRSVPPIAAPTDAPGIRAIELCTGVGLERARGLGEITGVGAVFRSTAGDVATWGGQRQHPEWDALPSSTLAAVCYFDADIVYAPGGPPAASSHPYVRLVAAVADDGAFMPLRAEGSRAAGGAPTGPPGSTRVR